MSSKYLIRSARILNEGLDIKGDVAISNGLIEAILKDGTAVELAKYAHYEQIDARGKLLIPGIIDDQVHFREPGLTYKADIYTESRAAIAGGITSFMEMPNTIPNTLTQELLEEKYQLAAEKSLANYSFYMGASNDNLKEVVKPTLLKCVVLRCLWGQAQAICWLTGAKPSKVFLPRHLVWWPFIANRSNECSKITKISGSIWRPSPNTHPSTYPRCGGLLCLIQRSR